MTFYSVSALERTMKAQEVILRAMSGEIHWIQAKVIGHVGVQTRILVEAALVRFKALSGDEEHGEAV